MGNVYNSLTHSSLAAAAYGWAATANPASPDYLCNLAGAVQKQVVNVTTAPTQPLPHSCSQDATKALALYQRVIALKPVFPEAHNNIANLYRYSFSVSTLHLQQHFAQGSRRARRGDRLVRKRATLVLHA
jgi:tetratricopeptide (TPR) repeat protein